MVVQVVAAGYIIAGEPAVSSYPSLPTTILFIKMKVIHPAFQ